MRIESEKYGGRCACGRDHAMATRLCVIEAGASEQLEQYLTEHVADDACILYLWQNQNTVVIGRNQNAWQECRTGLLEQEGGTLARRLSGGGAVFHDMGNLNFTFSVSTENYDLPRQQRVILEACRLLGIQAELSGRNDLLAQGRKFSGNSFYSHAGCAFHNGTLLVNVDMANLGKYLTPSKTKLESKGVASVRSRVINLTELKPDLTIDAMATAMVKAFESVYGLEAAALCEQDFDADEIERRYDRFHSEDWVYGRSVPCSFSCAKRFSWGEATIELAVENAVCAEAALRCMTSAAQTSVTSSGSRLAAISSARHIETIRFFIRSSPFAHTPRLMRFAESAYIFSITVAQFVENTICWLHSARRFYHQLTRANTVLTGRNAPIRRQVP